MQPLRLNFFKNDKFTKDSIILFLGLLIAHLLTFLFQVVMGRTLISEEYAILITLLGILNIFVIPIGVVATTVNRFSSLLIQQNRQGDIKRLFYYWWKRMLIIGIFLSLFLYFFSESISNFFHVERQAPIYIFAFIVIGLFLRPIVDGVLMGMQTFFQWSLINILGWLARLLLGAFLVIYISSFAGWGLLGHGIGFYTTIIVGIVLIFKKLNNYSKTDLPLPNMNNYVLITFFILLGYSIILSADIILVKHLFPYSAGDFAYAAVLARMIFFISQPFTIAMFPKVVSEKKETSFHFKLYLKTLLIVLLITFFTAIIFIFFSSIFFEIVYGISKPSVELIRWSHALAWCMIPISLLNTSIYYNLALNNFYINCLVIIFSILYLCIAFLSITDVDALLLILFIISVISFLCIFTISFVRFLKRDKGTE